MKNNYELKQTMILSMENEALRERIKELLSQINELKKENEIIKREMVQRERNNTVIQK